MTLIDWTWFFSQNFDLFRTESGPRWTSLNMSRGKTWGGEGPMSGVKAPYSEVLFISDPPLWTNKWTHNWKHYFPATSLAGIKIIRKCVLAFEELAMLSHAMLYYFE